MLVTSICEVCHGEFQLESWDVKRGRGRFCSRKCYHKNQIGHPSYMPDPTEERVCMACGKVFLVGGRGKPPKNQKLCSGECQRLSRYRHGTQANELSVADAAYIAGFIDGEGSIFLEKRKNKASLRLSVSNTNKAVMDWIIEKIGVGVVHSGRKQSEKNKQVHIFILSGESVETLLKQIEPYLIVKKEQAKLALETQERLRNPALNADRVWQQEYIAQMRSMNKRGPNQMDLALTAGMYVIS